MEPPELKAPPASGALLPTTRESPSPTPQLYTSDDGLLTAPRPTGDSWECIEQLSRPPKPIVTVIKCRQRVGGERFFFLLAKDYEIAPERRLPVDAIIQDALASTYDELFESFEIRTTTAIEHQGVEGRELSIDAVHAKLGPIRKLERLFVRGDHVLIVSAEGLPELFDTYAAEIEAWIEGVVFLNLAP